MRGVPLKVIQELMGHATIEMTLRYAHLRAGGPGERGAAARPTRAPVPRRNGQRRRRGTLRAHEATRPKKKPSNPVRLLGF